MFTRKEVTRLVPDSMDRPLSLGQRIGMRLHLMICKLCSRYEQQLYLIRNTLKFYALGEEDPRKPYDFSLSPETGERLRYVLRRSLVTDSRKDVRKYWDPGFPVRNSKRKTAGSDSFVGLL
jgi:hypothetical protein